jgi:hypothetical protein
MSKSAAGWREDGSASRTKDEAMKIVNQSAGLKVALTVTGNLVLRSSSSSSTYGWGGETAIVAPSPTHCLPALPGGQEACARAAPACPACLMRREAPPLSLSPHLPCFWPFGEMICLDCGE